LERNSTFFETNWLSTVYLIMIITLTRKMTLCLARSGDRSGKKTYYQIISFLVKIIMLMVDAIAG
jgi:hypothetical protein